MQDKLMEINNTDKTESVSTFLLLAYFLFPRGCNFSYIKSDTFIFAAR